MRRRATGLRPAGLRARAGVHTTYAERERIAIGATRLRRARLSGVTLVELLINVSIVGAIGTVTAALFLGGFRNWQVSRVKTEIQRDARQSLDLMSRYFRQGLASTVTIRRKANQPAYSWATFTYKDTNNVNHTVDIYQNGRILTIEFDGVQRVITRQLRAVGFTYPDFSDPRVISISVTFEGGTFQGGTKAFQLSLEKVRIMND